MVLEGSCTRSKQINFLPPLSPHQPPTSTLPHMHWHCNKIQKHFTCSMIPWFKEPNKSAWAVPKYWAGLYIWRKCRTGNQVHRQNLKERCFGGMQAIGVTSSMASSARRRDLDMFHRSQWTRMTSLHYYLKKRAKQSENKRGQCTHLCSAVAPFLLPCCLSILIPPSFFSSLI
jgi:hypothetical protein